MDEVLIEVNGAPPLELKFCDVDIMYFFHEANVSERRFGYDVLKVYEDISHYWGIIWTPRCNEKFASNFFAFLTAFLNNEGYEPPIRDTVKLFCANDLRPVILQPKFRKQFQRALENNGGYMAERNRGFVHYMVFDDMLQAVQDAFASRGIVI